MPDFLIRGLARKTMERLRARAKRHGRSLQSEARQILEHAGENGPEDIASLMDRLDARWKGHPKLPDSAAIIRELRDQ